VSEKEKLESQIAFTELECNDLRWACDKATQTLVESKSLLDKTTDLLNRMKIRLTEIERAHDADANCER